MRVQDALSSWELAGTDQVVEAHAHTRQMVGGTDLPGNSSLNCFAYWRLPTRRPSTFTSSLLARWRTTADPAVGEQLADAYERMLEVLKVHLRREVVEVVPVVEQVVTKEEWNAMADHSVGAIPKSRLLPQLGMLLANSTPEERKSFYAGIPLGSMSWEDGHHVRWYTTECVYDRVDGRGVHSAPIHPRGETDMDHAAALRRMYDAINAHDVDAVAAVMADDFVDHEEIPGLSPTKEGTVEFFRVTIAAFPDLRFEAEDVLVDGDKVVARARFTGTQRGEIFGVPASGKRVDVALIDIIRFGDDGLAHEHWGVMDELAMMQQIGAIPDGPPA